MTVALPHLVGGQSIISTVWQPLAQDERMALRASATTVKQAIDALTK